MAYTHSQNEYPQNDEENDEETDNEQENEENSASNATNSDESDDNDSGPEEFIYLHASAITQLTTDNQLREYINDVRENFPGNYIRLYEALELVTDERTNRNYNILRTLRLIRDTGYGSSDDGGGSVGDNEGNNETIGFFDDFYPRTE